MAAKKEKAPRVPFLEVAGFKCYADSMSYAMNHPNGRTTYHTSLINMLKSLDATILKSKLQTPRGEPTISNLLNVLNIHNGEMHKMYKEAGF